MFCFLTKALIVIVDMLVHFRPKKNKTNELSNEIAMHLDQIFNCVYSFLSLTPLRPRLIPLGSRPKPRYGIVVAILGEEGQSALPLIQTIYIIIYLF